MPCRSCPTSAAATFGNSTNINNTFFPLPGGTINSYGAALIDPETGEEETERNDHFATFETKMIEGVEAVVVRDTAYADGVLVEDTLDWYAQDDEGNVWYLGEIATNYNYDDDGNFIGTDFGGSWEAGVDGASPGWIMRAAPMAGDSYFQEFYAGVAEDEGEVIATGLHVETDFGSFDDVVKILDTSALEPGVGAYKYFAPGVGLVLEEEVVFSEDEPELVIEITEPARSRRLRRRRSDGTRLRGGRHDQDHHLPQRGREHQRRDRRLYVRHGDRRDRRGAHPLRQHRGCKGGRKGDDDGRRPASRSACS